MMRRLSISFIFIASFTNAAEIETGFTSNNTAEKLVIKSIDSSKKQLLFAAYSFTNKNIASALVDAKKRGVSVFAVLDKSQLTEKYSAVDFLLHAKIPVRIPQVPIAMIGNYIGIMLNR